ncbi:hypothetical protein BTM25_10520 [Actinomadura rubteroloni]|uniref:Uncharacterized protein n=2 Tax=Actinomadura rubteroloni TaxID=1926885 RepID=A0A2P4UNM2_9ACTN|nr:hypothetical protein BTM25_10520 [Actinomadura rubteroloni]
MTAVMTTFGAEPAMTMATSVEILGLVIGFLVTSSRPGDSM